ncbi:MAG TPA: rod shape-determining protein MreD [Oculatellaceae cyanobacterium]
MIKISKLSLRTRQILNGFVIVFSVILCLLILPTRLSGMEIFGFSPNWLLIWVVTWSIKRSPVQGAFAGLVLGLIQDGMTSPHPSHAISLMLVGFLSARIQKQRFIQEDFISIALIVFGMAVVGETITAAQYMLQGDRNWGEIWIDYQLIALASAIVSSLWAPVVYYPLNRWWVQMNLLQQS